MLLGTAASASRAPLPHAWFDAVCDAEARVKPMMDEVNASRAMARALARKGRPR